MALSPRKKEQLTAFLGSLPGAAALKLFAALEADRASGGRGLPHNMLLDDLRARLLERGAIPPPRRVDARRMFFTPFEDFFIGARTGKKRSARIARSSLEPVWRLMMTDPALTEAAFAAAALDDAIAAGTETLGLERTLFIAAEAGLGRLCARAREDAHVRESICGELGGEAAYQDMDEIRRLLAGVTRFKDLHAAIPSSAPSLDESGLYELRGMFLSAYDESPAIAAYLLLALKGRLEKPWRALEVYYHLARGGDERLIAAKETVTLLPESLFEDLETMARSLERDGAGALDVAAARVRVGYFADFAEGLARQASRAGDNVFVNRIEACREVAGEAHDRFAEQALTALRQAMPVRHAGGSSKLMSLRPDIAVPLKPQTVDAAKEAAGLIAEAPQTARRLGADPGFVASLAEEAGVQVEAYAKDLVSEIRAAEGAERNAARRMLEQILEVAEPFLPRDEIGLIRDRAAAAAVTV